MPIGDFPAYGAAAAGRYPHPAIAWSIVAALFVAYIFSFIDRMIIGLLVDPIKADLHLTDTEISLLQGLAFALFYTIAGIPLGRLIDRRPRMKIVAAGVALWSVMTALCATAGTFGQFFMARMGVGVGEATLSPAAYSIISDSFPRKRLGLAIGVYGLGSAIGAGLAFFLGAVVITWVASAGSVPVPWIGELRGWQVAFVAVGLPGLFIAVLFLMLPEPARLDLGRGGVPVETIPMREVIAFSRNEFPFLGRLFLAAGLVNIGVAGALAWYPAMLMRALGLDVASAGYLVGSALILGGLLGLIGGGIATDRYGGGLPRARVQLCGAVTGLTAVSALLFPLANSAWASGSLFAVFFIAGAMTIGVVPVVIQQVVPNQMRATISAAYLFVTSLVGLGLGPTVIAVVGDIFFPFEAGIRYALAIACPISYALAAVVFFGSSRATDRIGSSLAE